MEAPEFFQGNYCSQFSAEKHHSSYDSNKTTTTTTTTVAGGDHFIVEDLLDFSNEDAVVTDVASAAFDINGTGNSTDSSSTVTVVDSSCNSSTVSGCEPNFPGDVGCRNLADAHFSSDLCVPYDDLAELEWLSNFVEESFSCDDLQKLQLISGMKAETTTELPNRNININTTTSTNPIFKPEMAVPAKARSKRSRAAPCNWASRLLLLSPTSSTSSETDIITSTGGPPLPPGPISPPLMQYQSIGKKTIKAIAAKKKDSSGGDSGEGSGEAGGRKCLHCATDKTPQWRTGPMGPKTLCNACGVRYKSGRLVPEYRPAASPTFVLTKHSNSHRKVLELRRQKEMMRHQQHHQQPQFIHHHHHQNMMFDHVSNGDDYLIHQHVGPDFRQLI